MPKTWTDADAQVLRSLREASRLSIEVMAKRHILSQGQVRELEGTDSGFFYSDEIKAYVGHRLLKAMGHVAPDATRLPSSASSFEPTAIPVAAPALAPTAPPPVMAPASGLEQTQSKPSLQDDAPVPGLPDIRPSTPAAEGSSSLKPLLWLVLVVLLGFALSSALRGRSTPATAGDAQPPVQAVPAVPEVKAPSATAADVSAAPAALPQAAPQASAPLQASAVPEVQACIEPNAKALTPYVSATADKPSSYLFLESMGEVLVCIHDGQGRKHSLKLRSGESQNVQGVAPYTLQTADWARVRVFFQGAQVKAEAAQAREGLLLQAHTSP